MLLIAASEANIDNIEGLPASRRETNQYKRSDRNIVRQIGSRRSRIYTTQQWHTDAWKR